MLPFARLLCLTFLLVVLACAQEGAPPGGPPDTFAPHVIEMMPPNGTTQVAIDTSPVITFNERIDPRSLEDAIFVVPLIPFKFKSNWDGNRITIVFEEALQKDKTYVITLGTNMRDLRSNRLTSAVTYAFSTGPMIDQGEITGIVALNERPVLGAFVWAYNTRMKPEPDPAGIPPDYIVQTGEDGSFRFTNLSLDTYRIFAFRDQGRDRRYDMGRDPLGVPTRDVVLSEGQIVSSPLWFQLAVRDTLAMYISSARAVHHRQVAVKLSKAAQVDLAADAANYSLINLDDGQPLAVQTAYRDQPDTLALTLLTAAQTAGASYRLTISNLRDYTGALIDSTDNTIEFIASSKEDMTSPILKSVWPANLSRGVPLQPDILFTFNKPVVIAENAITLTDSLDQNITAAFLWRTPVVGVLRPEALLVPDMQYTINILTNRVRGSSGQFLENSNSESDSIRYIFYTIDPAEYGMMTGAVVDEDSSATGSIHISIANVLNRSNIYQTRIPEAGSYRFNEILPGRYTVYAFRDANQNGRFDFGTVAPFAPAERAIVYPDTIPVRGGWESEGIDLRLRP